VTEIPKANLKNYFGKEIILKEGMRKSIVIFDEIKSGWLCGFNKTNNSFIQILLSEKQTEDSAKYFEV
jgi:hypothetical protein